MKHRLHDFSARLWCATAGNIPATQQENLGANCAARPCQMAGRAESPMFTKQISLTYVKQIGRDGA